MKLTRRTFSTAVGASMLGGFNIAHAQSDKIILGQSAPFTGPAAQLGIQFYQGAKVYFDQVNAQGGVG
ncbi:MAG: ABC transporter permease, partial [Polaromonas sp.]|nr:ABC transporter permease [Polaromonas sp.]